MKALKQAIIFGFLAWLLPFIFSILIFFLHDKQRPLFESLMSVFGVFTAVLLVNLYFKDREKTLRQGVILGLIWVVISLFFDFLFFIVGPVKMQLLDYIKDIGISYLSIPIVTIGFSYQKKINNQI